MMTDAVGGTPDWKTPGALFALVLFLAACALAAAIGSYFTFPAIPGWYAELRKPPFAPPNWVFGPVWSILYALMGFAAWRVWLHLRRGDRAARTALLLFAVQLVLNVLWSALFFGLRNPLAGLIDIIALEILIVLTTIAFWRVDRLAGLAFIPYLIWVSFASVLNGAVWWLNQ
jgi:tryptophan-rich sensory protein